MRVLTLALVLLTASAALAGCAMPGDEEEPTPTPTATTTPEATPTPTVETTPTPEVTPTPNVTPTPETPMPSIDASTFTVALADAPTQAKPNGSVSFVVSVAGARNVTSDHIGAHFANNATSPPDLGGMTACAHVNGTLPGSYNVTCTFAALGTWHLFGHARAVDNGTTFHYWSTPAAVKVRDLNLTLTAPTTPVSSGTQFDITLNVTGAENFTSDHIGAHFWNATNANPTVENATGACDHVTGGVVGVVRMKCTITTPSATITQKDYFLRGHVRQAEGATTLHWWSAEVKVTVLPSLI